MADSLSNTSVDSQMQSQVQLDYWNSQTPDVNGMLGGYPQVSRIDLQGSKNFIAKVRRMQHSRSPSLSTPTVSPSLANGKARSVPTRPGKYRRVVDCGAGIGRITSGLLVNLAEVVDVVEPIQKFADVIIHSELTREGHVGGVYVQGLEDWQPGEGEYNVVWNQWCLGHLTDVQLVAYLKRAARALRPPQTEDDELSWIMVKENLSTDAYGDDIFDQDDSSVTRSDEKWKKCFADAGLSVIRSELQSGFPRGLYPVKMYALRPK